MHTNICLWAWNYTCMYVGYVWMYKHHESSHSTQGTNKYMHLNRSRLPQTTRRLSAQIYDVKTEFSCFVNTNLYTSTLLDWAEAPRLNIILNIDPMSSKIFTMLFLPFNNWLLNTCNGQLLGMLFCLVRVQIHSLQIRCSPSADATCNCGLLVQSGDDVIKLAMCPTTFQVANDIVPDLEMTLFNNGELTSNTHIFSLDSGNGYYVSFCYFFMLSILYIKKFVL